MYPVGLIKVIIDKLFISGVDVGIDEVHRGHEISIPRNMVFEVLLRGTGSIGVESVVFCALLESKLAYFYSL